MIHYYPFQLYNSLLGQTFFARESSNPSSTGSMRHWKNKIKQGAGADVPLYKPTQELGRKLKHWDLAWQFSFMQGTVKKRRGNFRRKLTFVAEIYFVVSRWIRHFWIIWDQPNNNSLNFAVDTLFSIFYYST